MFYNIYFKLYKFLFGACSFYRRQGAVIGEGCRFVGDVSFGSEPYLVYLGNNVSVSNSRFVTHDGGVWVFRRDYPGINVFKKISIGNNVFIGDWCVILPGTIIGDNVIIGAGSVVRGELNSNSVYAGVPVRFIKTLSDYKEKILSDHVIVKAGENKKDIIDRLI